MTLLDRLLLNITRVLSFEKKEPTKKWLKNTLQPRSYSTHLHKSFEWQIANFFLFILLFIFNPRLTYTNTVGQYINQIYICFSAQTNYCKDGNSIGVIFLSLNGIKKSGHTFECGLLSTILLRLIHWIFVCIHLILIYFQMQYNHFKYDAVLF